MTGTKADVRVELGARSYQIEIGSGNLGDIGRFLATSVGRASPQAFVISDSKVAPLYLDAVLASLQAAGSKVASATIPAGEEQKSPARCIELWEKMLAAGADRKTVVVAVGGGVIGDLAGFVASTFARGLDFVQVPTTLLSQVDSSVGGKVGVNLPHAKNMVGSFWQPKGVLIDTTTLQTLSDREYRSGLAEVVKYGVIQDAAFFGFLEQHIAELQARDPATLQYVIRRCCEMKAAVVQADEREETDIRATLNYGHTFGHAVEAVTRYGFYLHGEAVAIGMACAARLAARLQRIDRALVERQDELLRKLDLPITSQGLAHDQLLDAMLRDKKTFSGKIRFVLPSRLGHVEVVKDVDAGLVRAVLAECIPQ